jgi:hypothetical protein
MPENNDANRKADAAALIERFNRSPGMMALSDDDKTQIIDSINEGDEETIRGIIKLLDEEDEGKVFFDSLIDDAAQDNIDPIIQAVRRKNDLHKISETERATREAEEKKYKKLLS